jgi:hypothetical protein
MIRKRKTIPFILLLVYLLPAAVQAQDILVFNDTTGLPDCAHDCMDLYSAQYECPPGRDRVDCFCDTGFVSSKPKGWGCDNSCTTKEERDRVLAFLARTCGTPEEEGDGETVKNKDHLGDSNSTYTDSKTIPQAEKAANWYIFSSYNHYQKTNFRFPTGGEKTGSTSFSPLCLLLLRSLPSRSLVLFASISVANPLNDACDNQAKGCYHTGRPLHRALRSRLLHILGDIQTRYHHLDTLMVVGD